MFACLLAAAPDARAQQQPPEDVPEFDGVNHGFASVIGSGIYHVNGRTALILRAPISFPILSTDNRWLRPEGSS